MYYERDIQTRGRDLTISWTTWHGDIAELMVEPTDSTRVCWTKPSTRLRTAILEEYEDTMYEQMQMDDAEAKWN